MEGLGGVDEVVDLFHEIVQEYSFTQAETQVSEKSARVYETYPLCISSLALTFKTVDCHFAFIQLFMNHLQSAP